jgi:DMSO/TMAO reductase YedYZ heme-binding membrane subunit
MSPSAAWSLHRAIGSTLLVSVAAHLGGLLLDSFIKLRFADVLIPFVSSYETTLISLGIIGFYLLLIVLGTSLYTMSGHPRLWRALHILGFPMFVLIMLHGLLLGTDRHQAWMLGLYWGSAGLITSALIYRLVWRYRSARPITLSTLSGNQHSL